MLVCFLRLIFLLGGCILFVVAFRLFVDVFRECVCRLFVCLFVCLWFYLLLCVLSCCYYFHVLMLVVHRLVGLLFVFDFFGLYYVCCWCLFRLLFDVLLLLCVCV